MKLFYFITFLLFIFLLAGCSKKEKDAENLLLEEYFKKRNITEEQKESFKIEDGLYLIKSGFSTLETLYSSNISTGDSLKIFYKGYLLSDEDVIFDETDFNNPRTYVFKVDQVIPGWEKSIPFLKIDETATIIIRSDHAYKGEQIGQIPPYSTLIFEVRILDIIKP